MSDLMTASELARQVGVSHISIHRWVGLGLPCLRRNPFIFERATALAWVERYRAALAKPQAPDLDDFIEGSLATNPFDLGGAK